jgi:hypothetical protein
MKTLLTFLAIAALTIPLSANEAADEGLVPLELELPRPLFVGTPTNIASANLEETTGQTRPPLLVPSDVELISLDKYVTSSDPRPIIGDLEMVTDGDKEGSDGSYIEIGPGPQWVQIDLEEEHEIFAIVVWHYHSQARAYRDVVVKLSADEDMLDGTTIVFNNDHDNTLGFGLGEDKEWIETYEGRPMDAKGALGRFVRLHVNGSTASPMSHYVEVEVYGRTPVE